MVILKYFCQKTTRKHLKFGAKLKISKILPVIKFKFSKVLISLLTKFFAHVSVSKFEKKNWEI